MSGSQKRQQNQKPAQVKNADLLIGIGQEEKKKCSKCGEVKPFSEFHKDSKTKLGIRSSCKPCVHEQKHPGKPMRIDCFTIKGFKLCLRCGLHKEYKHFNYTKGAKLNLAYHCRDCGKKMTSKYYSKNKQKFIDNNRMRKRERILTDNEFVISRKLRCRIKAAITNGYSEKAKTSIELLGCTPIEARKYIESKFLPGMTWKNNTINGWHIDHKIPVSSFDLTDPEQQKICFHYTNLQPLWSKCNFEKGATNANTN